MTATEILREEVKHYVDQADDKSLRMVKAILEIELEDEEVDWYDEMPAELKALVEAGINDSEAGLGIAHEEMVKKYSQWLKK